MKILIGTLIYRQGAYIFDKFLANQEQMHRLYPQSELVLATAEEDYVPELESVVASRELRANVLFYKVEKPPYTKSPIWNITCGREAIRKYMLSQDKADGLLFFDADMLYEPGTINILVNEIEGSQVLFSGAPRKDFGIGLAGAGCLIMKKEVLKKLKFRCYEFMNGQVIYEDNVLEMDLFSTGAKVKKGFFVSMDHYINAVDFKHLDQQKVNLPRKLSNNLLLRYLLFKFSIKSHYNFAEKLKWIINILAGLPRNMYKG